jgi:hypothetical protein
MDMTKFKKVFKKYVPKTFLNLYYNYLAHKKTKAKRIDLSCINLIQKCDINKLTNQEYLELELLPALGFNNELLHEFPDKLYKFCGNGLLHWQYPNQFSKYLILLSKLKISTYLEIGVRHGGTFVITTQYLDRFHPIKKALSVDINECKSLNNYHELNNNFSFIKSNSQSPEFKESIKDQRFDLTLIDGDHEENGCRNDFNLMKNKSNIIVLHDIKSVMTLVKQGFFWVD